VAPGSEVWIFAELSIEERDRRFIEEDFDPSHSENLTIIHSVGDPKVHQATYFYIYTDDIKYISTYISIYAVKFFAFILIIILIM
jgi:hypothetical protein